MSVICQRCAGIGQPVGALLRFDGFLFLFCRKPYKITPSLPAESYVGESLVCILYSLFLCKKNGKKTRWLKTCKRYVNDRRPLSSIAFNPRKVIMAQYICPSCGSKYFRTPASGPKIIFQIAAERTIQIIQSATAATTAVAVETHDIYCGACSWHGCLEDVVESHRDKAWPTGGRPETARERRGRVDFCHFHPPCLQAGCILVEIK